MKYNWEDLSQLLQREVEAGGKFLAVSRVATFLKIPQSTVYDAFTRGDLPAKVLGATAKSNVGENPFKELADFSFRETGNEATLKFKHGEPLTAQEALEISGVDSKEWRIIDQRINMWQMGRKDKQVDLTYNDGQIDGFVKDSGEIHKTYLYQIEIKLTRINRVAVKAILKPIHMTIPEMPNTIPYSDSSKTKVLFIADPHFGFHREMTGILTPFHHRSFLGSLLKIARTVLPDVIIWNGDVLDLADWSSFDSEPGLLYNTQLAGIEAAWLLGQFRKRTRKQVVIEGNHDQRLQRLIIKNMKAAYQLRPVHDLQGEPLMSVPRFLGLDSIQTEWMEGYPTANFRVGSAKFFHGKTVRKGSGKTVSAEMTDATGSRFFGHIHRYELATKYIEDSGKEIWVGSPGCACDKRVTPGANENHNWQIGAFLIHMEDDEILGVEHIRSALEGPTIFRGFSVQEDYYPDFQASLPDEFQGQFRLT